jgi:nitroimidazol reductase NimA-like FMN-containing flavoprotein (pyridoxamine 5'-phosphate oxidase superfamily)
LKSSPEAKIRSLLHNQKLAVLGTQERGRPYANLVAFVPTEDLKHIILATAKYTRKYANLKANPHVSLLIDNRDNMESDFHRGMAVTALGAAEELTGKERAGCLKRYRDHHPYLGEFVASPSLSLFRVTVETYYLVTEFQNVVSLKMGP